MSTATVSPIERHNAEVPWWPVKRFTVEEYQHLAEIGAIHEDDNLELLDGWLVPKMTKIPLRDGTIDVLHDLLREVLPRGWHVRCQNALVTPDSVPEPDLAVVRGTRGRYRGKHPTAADVSLVVEVADSSVTTDRVKGRIYARAGVVEYWIVNLVDWRIERMTGPQPDGSFTRTEMFTVNDRIPVALDGAVVVSLSLVELLTPPA
uniref:Uma2 family endonuclease n=1 Tax=Schlesneria paludicola TaxID=360056 RepID=A0A7C2P8H2_9PLAN